MLRILALLPLLLAATARAEDWSQWLGTQRDGVWREDGILTKFPSGGPKVVWRQPLGSGYAGPAVAGGKVFVMDRIPEGKPSTNAFDRAAQPGKERCVCLDEATGKELWNFTYDCPYRISYASGPRCTPTVDGDLVYFLGAMGDLFCFKTTGGEPVWKKNFVKDYGAKVPVWGYACHPLVDGDKLICVGGGGQKLVVAFDKKTGKELWTSLDSSDDFGYSPPSILELAGNRQLVIWSSTEVAGLDPATGKRQWTVPFAPKAALTAPNARKVDDDKVLVVSFYNGSKLIQVGKDGKSAKVVWEGKSNSERADKTDGLHSIMCTPLVRDGFIYGVCSYGELRCLDAKTGQRKWMTMQATRGSKTPDKIKKSEDPTGDERWSLAFIIPSRKNEFLFNEQGDLIIAELSPTGYKEIDRANILEPTNLMARRPTVWTHPAFANKCMVVRNDKEIVRVSLAE